MSFFVDIYNTVFYQPLYNALVFLSGILPFNDLGIAIVILTIIVKFIIFPLSHKSIVTQRKMRSIEPEIKAIKDKYKKDNQEQAKKVMELYREHGINPFSGCVMILIQLPIIFALYRLFIGGLEFTTDDLYFFVSLPETIKMSFLGLIDLAEKSYLLAAFAGISQFYQMKLALPPMPKKPANEQVSFKNDFARSMNLQMRYMMPAFVFFIALSFSSAIALYWTTMNLFAIIHESIVRVKAKKLISNGDTKKDNQKNNGGDSGKIDNRSGGGNS